MWLMDFRWLRRVDRREHVVGERVGRREEKRVRRKRRKGEKKKKEISRGKLPFWEQGGARLCRENSRTEGDEPRFT